MGILIGGPNGGVKGKFGSVVGYYSNGKWILRSLPKKSIKNKRGTVLQKESRSLFIKAQQFLSPIVPFIRVGFNLDAHANNRTAHNSAKSYLMLNSFNEAGEIDFSKVLVTYGNLPGASNVTVEKDDLGLHFTWNDHSTERYAQPDDQVMLLAYGTGQTAPYCLMSGAKRSKGKETLECDTDKGSSYHLYISFISDNRQRISKSSYLGEVTF